MTEQVKVEKEVEVMGKGVKHWLRGRVFRMRKIWEHSERKAWVGRKRLKMLKRWCNRWFGSSEGGRRIWNKGFKKWKHLKVLVLLFWEWKKCMRTMRTFLCLSIIGPRLGEKPLKDTSLFYTPLPGSVSLSPCLHKSKPKFWETENKVKCLPKRSQCFSGKDRTVHSYYKWTHMMLLVVKAIL